MAEVAHRMETRRGEILVVIGVVLLFFGPTLNFLDVEGPGGSFSGSGYDLEEGSTYVLAGIVALIGLAMAWFMKGGARKAGGIIVLLAGLFGTYGGFVDAFSTPEGVDDSFDISHGIGTYVVLIAGLIVVAGAIMLMKSEEPAPTVPPATTPPPSEPPPV